MEDEKKATTQNEKKPEPKGKETKETKSSLGNSLSAIRGEFKKIIWPSRKDLLRDTVTVIVTSTFFGLVIVGLDGALAFAYKMFIQLFT